MASYTPLFVGIREIAELGDVSRQTAHEWTARSSFPAPVAELSMGRVWDEREVKAWLADKRDADEARERVR